MPVWLDELRRLLPADRASTRPADLEQAGRDESTLPPVPPAAVAWPLSTEEVAAVLRMAYDHGLPVTARGAGSSLEGNPIPVRGGLVLDFSRMNSVLEIQSDDLLVRVQPGVVYAELNRELRSLGLFFPPHPGGSADVATIGGMVANNASGIYSVKYGGTRSYVRAATAVTGTGTVVELGTACRKTSSGYHLIGLLVGSEGTLALATEITLALAPLPVARQRAAVFFPAERHAAAAIADMMRYGVDLAAVEFLDRRCFGAVNRLLSADFPERPAILLEIHGTKKSIESNFSAARSLANDHEGELVLNAAPDPWEARHHVTRAIQALRPGAPIVRSDLAFPVSQLPQVVTRCHQLADDAGVTLHTFGHAGLGILHALILVQGDGGEAYRRAAEVKDAIVRDVLERGGSVSGEHGLGLGNRKYAAAEHGASLELMRAVKRVFDPMGILNPGKLWE